MELHKRLGPGAQFSYQKIAETYKIQHSTLRRHHQGKTQSRAHKAKLQQNLSPQQEAELVRYIEELSERGLPPTRKMVQNFGVLWLKRRFQKLGLQGF
jgi:hypothetical protein